MDYEKMSLMLKALADPNRMKIVDILSCGSQCACDVQTHFDFTQPTLSHHMKVLEKAGVITVTKQGQWHHYTLRGDFVQLFMDSMTQLFLNDENCICKQKERTNKGEIEDEEIRMV